jgi:RNA polymerase sigma-B factor
VLAQRLGREPTARELAAELGAEESAVAEALTCSTSLRPESLDAPFDGKSWGDTLPSPDNCIERSDDIVSLRAAVNGLTPAEKELLYRRYFNEETQQQIGDHLGMTQMQVSRKLARILVLLQERLTGAAGGGSADIRIA